MRDFERGLDAARAADAALARGERKPLLGMPMTVKESFNVAGLPTTWGIPQQKDFVPAEDALSITRVKDAGGVILGKTNVPLGLADWQSYNEIYGTTNNPWDLGRTPGGSSGGSAAALAAGYGPLSLGSDIGGSLRVPAFHCGVYAHKPTHALVPLARPYAAAASRRCRCDRDLAVIGPMARSAADLSLLLDVIAGPDPLEAGVGLPARAAAAAPRRAEGFPRAGDRQPIRCCRRTRSCAAAIEKLAANLGKAGVKVARESPLLPDFARCLAALHADAAVVPRRVLPAGDLCRRAGRRQRRSPPDDTSLGAERLRGMAAQPSRLGVRRRRRARAARAMARTVQDIRCGDLPDHADAGLSARSFAGAGKRAASISTARTMPIRTSWPGPASPRCRACRRPRSRPAFRRTACRSACRSSAPGWRTARR